MIRPRSARYGLPFFTLLVIFRRLCTLEAQQCTSQPGGSEGNDNRVKNEGFNSEWPEFRTTHILTARYTTLYTLVK